MTTELLKRLAESVIKFHHHCHFLFNHRSVVVKWSKVDAVVIGKSFGNIGFLKVFFFETAWNINQLLNFLQRNSSKHFFEIRQNSEGIKPKVNGLRDYLQFKRKSFISCIIRSSPSQRILEAVGYWRKNASLRIEPTKDDNKNWLRYQDGHWTHRLSFEIATIRARGEMNYLVDSPACQNFNFLKRENERKKDQLKRSFIWMKAIRFEDSFL